ncbi:MAG TPA: sodium-translocating pyrophosphatase [Candidatus Limnocylindrales bacterium]|nr:sodium-translocating pyrophosphatase [Candidatus Limnocylindrales bacterium]
MTLVIVLAISILGLGFAWYLARFVLAQGTGKYEMQEISNAIREGAEAFLKRQYKTIAILSGALGLLILLLYGFLKEDWNLAVKTTFAFFLGAGCSALAGYIGMYVSVRANIRTANAALTSLNNALIIALRGGAVSGITVVAMSLLGVGGLFLLYGGLSDPQKVPFLIVGYGFGASFVALFAQLGGGIYTKAADVGADLVGKVEVGIPEDDPRNPAVIADLVGDNVGDCAGRGADLFESTAAENIGAMILGVALFPHFGIKGILFPLLARAFGLIASMAGVMVVKTDEQGDPMKALNKGYYVTAVLATIGFYIATATMLKNNLWFFLAGFIGILTSIAFVYITQYYTEYKYRPVKEIAQASQTGPATNIITGLSVALECTALPVVVISAAILFSYYCGQKGMEGGGLYGTAVATMGMLATCAYILAMDTFGPITDNAGGIIEMSQQPDEVRRKTDRLDAVGNTTKALTKGYAIGSAALAAFLLFSAYLDEVAHITGKPFHSVDIAKVEVFIGGLLGAMLVFLFSGLAIRAVGKAAYYVINDVRAQFKENPEILKGKAKPNYARCVDIVTLGALKEMVLPGVLAVGMPVVVGLLFRMVGLGAEAVAALLMIGTIAGILAATIMNNGGGAWDNAKKYIETGVYGGKKSDAHKAAVVGDTVGDPLKDTAGPSLHVLIKLLSTITLVLAPLFV